MRRYLFIYYETVDHHIYRSESYENRLVITDKHLPKSNDAEVISMARKEEVPAILLGQNTAGERNYTKTLAAIYQIAREFDIR